MTVVRADEKDDFEDMAMGPEGMEVRRRKRSSQLGDYLVVPRAGRELS